MTKVAALILAAGRGSRFGASGTKATAVLDGVALVRRVATTALRSNARPVIVVTGHAASAVADALAGLDVTFVANARYAEGLSTSLRAGIAALPPDIDGVLVLLADMPMVTTQTLNTLIATFADARPKPQAVAPRHDGRRGNPILLSGEVFAEIAALVGDRGAGALLERWHVVDCEVADPGIFADVDTPGMLSTLSKA